MLKDTIQLGHVRINFQKLTKIKIKPVGAEGVVENTCAVEDHNVVAFACSHRVQRLPATPAKLKKKV